MGFGMTIFDRDYAEYQAMLRGDSEKFIAETDESKLSSLFNWFLERLYWAECIAEHSYRGVIYSAFGFPIGSIYMVGCEAGLLDIHNAAYGRKNPLGFPPLGSPDDFGQFQSVAWQAWAYWSKLNDQDQEILLYSVCKAVVNNELPSKVTLTDSGKKVFDFFAEIVQNSEAKVPKHD